VGGHAWDEAKDLGHETLSLRVTGCNGMMPRRNLRDSTISELVAPPPNVRAVRNLVAPTMPVYPPVNDRFQWRVLSHLAPNFLSLMDAEALRGALALYDWTDDEINRRRLAGIQQVRETLLEQVRGGGIERGARIEVTLDSNAFAGEGDIYLFGELLDRFFAQYAEVNLFTQLVIVSWPSGAQVEWPPSHATRSPL
jgi:type VI secretion system protein ImpG